ncbi:MAG: site-specific integrase, partial [Pseudomonadota bacterium]
KRGLIEKAPHILRPPKPPPRDRWMTREEARAMIDAAAWPHARLAMILLLSTAARVSAILELTWDRVDFEAGTIQLSDDLNSSRKKSRATVPMNAMARAALTEAKTGAVSDHVIEYGGKPIKSLKKAIAGAAKRAKLEGISAHVFRHTAAVWMAEGRVPMERIAQFLGHRDSKVTERIYARFSPDHLREEAEVLNLGIWAAGSPGPKNRL